MSGSILENLSGKKLSILILTLFLLQIICFLIGGLIPPQPSNTEHILATNCLDESNGTQEWFYSRGKGSCRKFKLNPIYGVANEQLADKIVFTFQMPKPKNVTLDYSRWQQSLIGVIQLEMTYHKDFQMGNSTEITLVSKLGYRNKQDDDNDWKLVAEATQTKNLMCTIDVAETGYSYDCNLLPLFELGSLHHDYYLLNIRIPVDYVKNINVGLGYMESMWLYVINQNGGFTKVWLSLKCVFFPSIIILLTWFWKRVSGLNRDPMLLEYMLLILGLSLILLNFPFEFLSLFIEMPYMLLLSDIRQGLFYSVLFTFWLIFAAEHLMIQETNKKSLKNYWYYLSGVAVCSGALLIFDICERGVQLYNPFYSIWMTNGGSKTAMSLLLIGGVSAGIYFLALCGLIWKVFCNMRTKKSNLPAMSQARRLHYTGIMYRFNFLMVTTIICAAITFVAFIIGHISESQWKWENEDGIEYSSAFTIGVFGMWNIYIFALIILYAPSYKAWPSQNDLRPVANEIEFSYIDAEPSEISSLTSFVKKTAVD